MNARGVMVNTRTLIDATLIDAAAAESHRQKGGGRSEADPDARWMKKTGWQRQVGLQAPRRGRPGLENRTSGNPDPRQCGRCRQGPRTGERRGGPDRARYGRCRYWIDRFAVFKELHDNGRYVNITSRLEGANKTMAP